MSVLAAALVTTGLVPATLAMGRRRGRHEGGGRCEKA
ncbi:UNVERIFIED_ORG: hypothetical protein FHR35_006223 [Microbispora rosea subsp. rosea]